MVSILIVISIFISFFLFLLLGQHISSLLIIVGVLGIFLLEGPNIIGAFIENDPFLTVASYTLTTVPLYLLMAQFILRAGIINDVYHLLYKLSRNSAGLLGSLTMVLGGCLGAVSGSGAASSAAMGQVAYPELVKRGYRKDVAGAIVAAAGSLSAIIPPSIYLIIYGSITQTSIGGLFIAAIIPGILLVLVFSLYTIIALKTTSTPSNVEAAVTTDEITFNNQSISRYLLVIGCGLGIVISIFGGIYTGVFTPTEAGAIGALISLITASLLGKVEWKFFSESIMSTIKVTGMAMMIMIGAAIFARFLSLSLLPRKIIELLGPIIDYPYIVLILLFILYFFLFMFIEGVAVIVMTVPIRITAYNCCWF